jgi:hypothetical protein
MTWRGDEDDIRVKKEDLVRAIEKLMNGEDERGCWVEGEGKAGFGERCFLFLKFGELDRVCDTSG